MTTGTTPAAPAAPAATTTAAASLLPPAAPTSAPGADPGAPAPTPAADNALTLPGKDATPEQWGEFYGKLGRPAEAKDYGLTVREGEDAAFVGEVAGVMHKYGLTKEQATGLQRDLEAKALERMGAAEQQRLAALDAKNQAEQTALKTELGERYEPQMELARRAVRQFAGDQAADLIDAVEGKLGYKGTMELFMRIGAGLGEHDANAAGGKPEPTAGERKSDAQVFYG